MKQILRCFLDIFKKCVFMHMHFATMPFFRSPWYRNCYSYFQLLFLTCLFFEVGFEGETLLCFDHFSIAILQAITVKVLNCFSALSCSVTLIAIFLYTMWEENMGFTLGFYYNPCLDRASSFIVSSKKLCRIWYAYLPFAVKQPSSYCELCRTLFMQTWLNRACIYEHNV